MWKFNVNRLKQFLIFLLLFSGSTAAYGFERGPLFTVDNESICKTDPQSACEYLVATRVTGAAKILNISAVPGDPYLQLAQAGLVGS